MSRGKQGEAVLQSDTVLCLQRENYNYYEVHHNYAADYNYNNEENYDYTANYDNYEEDNETNNNIVTEADIRDGDQGPE